MFCPVSKCPRTNNNAGLMLGQRCRWWANIDQSLGRSLVSAVMTFHDISQGWSPRVVLSTAAFHARVRDLFPGLGGLKKIKMFLPHAPIKLSRPIVGSLRDRQVAYSASDLHGLNFESCVWRAVLSHSSHHSQDVFLAQFSLLCAYKWPKARIICYANVDNFGRIGSTLTYYHIIV